MAEAAVEARPLNRFFCHQCSTEISPNLPDYTCPRCESGFIEEMSEDLAESNSQEEAAADPASEFADLFGRSFLQSFQHHLDPNREVNIEADSDTDEDGDVTNAPITHTNTLGSRPQPFPGLFAAMPGARISIRTRPGMQDPTAAGTDHRNQALQSILQTLLSGLMGGGAQGHNQGAAGFGFPLGGVLNMYGNPGDYAWGTGGLDNIITQLLNQIEGTGPPPANKDDIDKLTEIVISNMHTEKGQQCSVCMEDFKLEEKVKGLPCQHMYHDDCILPWLELHGTCPVCRKPINGATNCDAHAHQGAVDANMVHEAATNHSQGSATSRPDTTSPSHNQNPDLFLDEDCD